MKIAAITTFPPSTFPHSSFAYHAILRFLKTSEIHQINVFADRVNVAEVFTEDKLTVNRCWIHNSSSSIAHLPFVVIKTKPDVIWLNFHYTLFGVKPAIVILGLLLPTVFRALGCPVVLLLHNFLAMVKLEEIGYNFSFLSKMSMKWMDRVAMMSLMQSNRVFVMTEEYKAYLSIKYPKSNVIYVEHDLYKIPKFVPINETEHIIATIGYFGTHKRLDFLLEAFVIIQRYLPDAILRIAGCSHPQKSTYFEDVMDQYKERSKNIEFLNYISDQEVPELFWNANIIVATNISNTGSSAILRYAAIYGRGVVAPDLNYITDLRIKDWGIAYYEPGNAESLAKILLDTLIDPDKQVKLGVANYRKAIQSRDEFLRENLRAFREISRQHPKVDLT